MSTQTQTSIPSPVTTQPKASATSSMKMKTLASQNPVSDLEPCTHTGNAQAMRLRGGGAAKECFIGLFSCFVCFECCKGCCECAGDILCCPCEMCC